MKKSTVLVLALALPVAQSFGATAYSNFGPGNGFNNSIGWTLSTSASVIGMDFAQGEQFTSAVSGNLTMVDAALGNFFGDSTVTMSLYADAGGSLGSFLGSQTATAVPGYTVAALDFSSENISLVAGQSYWLVGSAMNDGWDGWGWNNTGAGGMHYANGQYSSNTQGAFDVMATPEPAPIAALGFGVLGFLARRRKK
jgi:hypothetical protein